MRLVILLVYVGDFNLEKANLKIKICKRTHPGIPVPICVYIYA